MKEPKPQYRKRMPKGIFWGVAGIIVLLIAGLMVSFYAARGDFGHGRQGGFSGMIGFFSSVFSGGKNTITSFGSTAEDLTSLAGEVNDIESSSVEFLTGENGANFVADLKNIQTTLHSLDNSTAGLYEIAGWAGLSLPSDLGGGNNGALALQSKMKDAESFLDEFVPWVSSENPRHVLIFFNNTSEMRPGGGFLGSYADITIADGTIKNVDVRDIADVDAAFAPNIIPPKPLQGVLTRFRPADANWFFDFPTTASETVSFFEQSSLYSGSSAGAGAGAQSADQSNAGAAASSSASGENFDIAIAVTPKVVSDLLSITGPISIGKPAVTFDSDNFMVETQKIVQEGQAESATYPKQVLRDLASAIMDRLPSLAGDDSRQLYSMAVDWIKNRDVMVYFKDPVLEGLAVKYGAAGDVYDLPENFNGDYFAYADADIGGGKSDMYISSTVSYAARIGADGTLSSHVALTRDDNADKSPYWWYKTANYDYMQFFVPEGSTIIGSSGALNKTIWPRMNYSKSDYSTDPLVASIESTEQSLFAYPSITWFSESGKRVFAAWSSVKPGSSANFSLDYSHVLYSPPADGASYQFIFEKQAGARRNYSIEIDAPLGYVFKENNLATYTYNSDDPPGRLIIDLTLEKL